MTSLPEAVIDSGKVRGLWRLHRGADGSTTRRAIFLGLPCAAPRFGPGREVIVYGNDASRSVGIGYEREARLWAATRR